MYMSGLLHNAFNSNDYRFSKEKTSISDTKVPRLGSKREEILKKLDTKYGTNSWRFAWSFGDDKFINFEEACEKYEDSYERFLKRNRHIATYLSKNARDVYDTNPSNVSSRFEYTHQEDDATHIQDIAVRKVMAKLKIPFKGSKLIQVRGTSEDKFGRLLSPMNVPFSQPQKVINSKKDKPSVEDFWQKNRVIQFLDKAIKT